MNPLIELSAHEDERGNRIMYGGSELTNAKVSITFNGSNNVVRIGDNAKIVHLTARFDGENATLEIGSTLKPRTGLRFSVLHGHQCALSIGEDVGSETPVFVCVSECQRVDIGKDCMFSSNVELRADDSHAALAIDCSSEQRRPAHGADSISTTSRTGRSRKTFRSCSARSRPCYAPEPRRSESAAIAPRPTARGRRPSCLWHER